MTTPPVTPKHTCYALQTGHECPHRKTITDDMLRNNLRTFQWQYDAAEARFRSQPNAHSRWARVEHFEKLVAEYVAAIVSRGAAP